MNNILDKVKEVLDATLGKVLLFTFAGSFIFTLLLSLLQKNNIAMSIAKSFASALIITLILAIVYTILLKVLGDVISEVKSEDISFDIENSSIPEYNQDIDRKERNEEVDKNDPLEIVAGEILNDKKSEDRDHVTETMADKTDSIKQESENVKKEERESPSGSSGIDKKDKMSYDNKACKSSGAGFDASFIDFGSDSDDIGSIVFADKVKEAVSSSNKTSSSDGSSKSSGGGNDGFIDFSKAAKSSPDLMAKAVRSMRSRDGEK